MDREQQEAFIKRNELQREEGVKIMKAIEDEKLGGYAYADDAQITISGKLMTKILSLLQNHQLHVTNMQAAYNNLSVAQDAMLMEDTDLLLACMNLHLENCRNGVAIPQKEKNIEQAKEKIKPIKKK